MGPGGGETGLANRRKFCFCSRDWRWALADGSNFSPAQTLGAAASLTLGQAAAQGLGLMAACGAPNCDRRAACDPAPWLAQGLRALPLSALETRLRCVCGGRSARLEPCAEPRPARSRAELFIFR